MFFALLNIREVRGVNLRTIFFHHRVTEDTENDFGRPGALRIIYLCPFSKRVSAMFPNKLFCICSNTYTQNRKHEVNYLTKEERKRDWKERKII
jgi:hypothetical protein